MLDARADFLRYERTLEEHISAMKIWLESPEFKRLITESAYRRVADIVRSSHSSLMSDLRVLNLRLRSGSEPVAIYMAFHHMDAIKESLRKGTEALAEACEKDNLHGFTQFSLRVEAFVIDYEVASASLSKLFNPNR